MQRGATPSVFVAFVDPARGRARRRATRCPTSSCSISSPRSRPVKGGVLGRALAARMSSLASPAPPIQEPAARRSSPRSSARLDRGNGRDRRPVRRHRAARAPSTAGPGACAERALGTPVSDPAPHWARVSAMLYSSILEGLVAQASSIARAGAGAARVGMPQARGRDFGADRAGACLGAVGVGALGATSPSIDRRRRARGRRRGRAGVWRRRSLAVRARRLAREGEGRGTRCARSGGSRRSPETPAAPEPAPELVARRAGRLWPVCRWRSPTAK